MKLVPCRWSRTGWKYVEAETKQHKFFTNPNRANCHGYSSPDQVKARSSTACSGLESSTPSASALIRQRITLDTGPTSASSPEQTPAEAEK